MSAVPKPRKLTAEEYLAVERAAEFKSEFFDGVMYPLHRDAPVGMAGASRQHNRVNENLSLEVGGRLKGGPCQSFSRDLRVRVQRTGLYAYPDLLIVCGTPEFEDDGDTLLNPTAIVEVLSPKTEKYDRGMKFRNYQRIESLKEYILVAQDEPLCERYVRQADGSWALVAFEGLDAALAFASVPTVIPLADVYAGVTFPEGGGTPGGPVNPPTP